MEKIKKGYKFKVISLLLLILFLLNITAAYGIDQRNSHLRPNILSNSEKGRNRLRDGLAAEVLTKKHHNLLNKALRYLRRIGRLNSITKKESKNWQLYPYDPFGVLPSKYLTIRIQGEERDKYLVRLTDDGEDVFGIFALPSSGIKPGHGLLMDEHMGVKKGDSLLDLGTGPLAYFPILAIRKGASYAVGAEINSSSVGSSKKGVAFNKLYDKISIVRSDLFFGVKGREFDKIITNPSMLPSPPKDHKDSNRLGSYDDGGYDGRLIIDQIISQAGGYIKIGGQLIIGQFEFLGTNRAFGKSITTFEMLEKCGFKPEIVGEYEIPITPTIEKRLDYIKSVFPEYNFVEIDDKWYHKFVVISGTYHGIIPSVIRREGMKYQHTIREEIKLSGHGLHTGKKINLRLKPAPANSGITFVRTDLPDTPEIKADVSSVRNTYKNVSVGSKQAEVMTQEHLFAALKIFGIDNIIIELDGPEIPIFDGSASYFERWLKENTAEQNAKRQSIEIIQPVYFSRKDEGVKIIVLPYDGFKVSCLIDFDNPAVGSQWGSYDIKKDIFWKDIAHSRTFVFKSELQELQSQGRYLGAEQGGVIIVGDKEASGDTGFKFNNEAVNHKILDVVGDLHLFHTNIQGHIIALESGHRDNVELVRILEEVEGIKDNRQQLFYSPEYLIDVTKRVKQLYETGKIPEEIYNEIILGISKSKKFGSFKEQLSNVVVRQNILSTSI